MPQRKITLDDMIRDPDGCVRIIRGRIVKGLLEAGYSPPPLKDHQALRLIDDIAEIGGDDRRTLDLTPQQKLILALSAEGDTAEEVAEKAGLSVETVKTYKKRLTQKMGARNMTHAVAMAAEAGAL